MQIICHSQYQNVTLKYLHIYSKYMCTCTFVWHVQTNILFYGNPTSPTPNVRQEQIAKKQTKKARLINDLQIRLASLRKDKEEIAQKEAEKACLINDLRNQFLQKEHENASLIKDLQSHLEQRETEYASFLKSHSEIEIAQRMGQKVLLIRNLRSQLTQKEIEAQKQKNEHTSTVRDLQEQLVRAEKECSQKADEHALLVKDLEKQCSHNDELTRRIHSQPQIDGETWQFQGDSSEWVSFTAALHTFGTLHVLLFPKSGAAGPEAFQVSGFNFLCT